MRIGVEETRSCVLGIDLGTSAVKLVAVSLDSRVMATAREKYATISTSTGQAEQDPEHWLKGLSLAAKKIRSRLSRKVMIEALALTGQMPTLVAMGGRKPIGPAITWQDSRADQWVGERVDHRLRREIYLKTGVPIDGRYLAPMFQFHYGSKPQRANLILSAKDFLFHTLTGSAITDPSTAAGYGLYNLRRNAWDRELCNFWGVSLEHLPCIKSSSFSAPLSKRGSQLLGCKPATPVVLGCADSVAGAHAISRGQEDLHTAIILTGSSTVILKCDAGPRCDGQSRYLVTPLAKDGMYAREADLLASGSARDWAAAVLERGGKTTKKSIWDLAYRVTPGADGLLFAPFLAGGEQGILWNPSLRGTISGLTLTHDGAKIARALLEGMCFEIRRCLEVLEEEAPLSSTRLAGWMAEIPQQSQLLADILGQPVDAFRLSSASAVGAALLSGLIDRKKYFNRTKAIVFRPSQKKVLYDVLYAKYTAQFPAAAASATPDESA
ncbi:MAG: FGGY-family carbohydrate kinase [Candidatus Sulfotelmatobacter sp.]|jgi:xylulokinase